MTGCQAQICCWSGRGVWQGGSIQFPHSHPHPPAHCQGPIVLPCGSAGKESACNAEDLGLILGSERLLTPVFWPGIPWTTVHGVAESDTTE